MTNEWKTYKVTIKNFDLLLSARNKNEAREIVLDAISQSKLPERLVAHEKTFKFRITQTKGLKAYTQRESSRSV